MGIELATLLSSLRSEIDRARLDSAGKDVRFRVDSIDLELQVAVEKTAEVDAGVRFWVVSMGGKGGATSTDTQVIRLKLGAVTSTGEEVFTGDEVSELLTAD